MFFCILRGLPQEGTFCAYIVIGWVVTVCGNKSKSGFTLIEVSIVVAIIGLLAMMSIPAVRKARTRSQITAVVNDLRVFGDAFEQYSMERGRYPAESHLEEPHHLPSDVMEGYLDAVKWASRTPLGGFYNWEAPSWGESGIYDYAGIALFEVAASVAQLRELDTMIDDGNLLTGRFRRTPNDRYTWIIEER